MNRSLLLLASLLCSTALAQPTLVRWSAETSPIPSNTARDPAILGSADGGFLVLGTDSLQVGAYAWRSSGQLQQVVPLGPVVAADSRRGLTLVVGASGAVFALVDVPDAGLAQLLPSASVLGASNVLLHDTADGGLSAWFEASGQLKHFEVGLAPFTLISDGTVTLPQVSTGLARDHRTGRLFVSQPTIGILTIDDAGVASFAASIDAGQLGASVGGLELIELADGGAWVFEAAASADAVSVFAFQAVNGLLSFEGSLEISAPDGGNSKVLGPTSLAVLPYETEQFTRGVLVVQDSFNANYKIVSFAEIDSVLPIPPVRPREDAGLVAVDGGVSTDGGSSADGGTDGGGGGISGGGGSTGHMTNPDFPPQSPCGCTTLEGLAALPALLLLWWIRRPSRS